MTDAPQVPPHDLDAEAVVISAVLFIPHEAFPQLNGFRPEHCYSVPNQWILHGAWDLHAQGHPVDMVAVAGWLRDRGKLESPVGGSKYITSVVDTSPAVGNVASHAARVTQLWHARQLANQCKDTAARLLAGGDPVELSRVLRERLESLHPPKQAIIQWRSALALCELLAGSGPRIPTGIQCIDDKLHGGMRVTKLLGVGGAPGAWKTSVCVQIADDLAQRGIAVLWLAYDEPAEAVVSRLLQARGIERCRTESPDDETLLVASEIDRLPLLIADNEPIVEAITEFARAYPNHERAVFIDSIQQAWSNESIEQDTQYGELVCLFRQLRKLREAPTTKCMVFMTSELNRDAYRASRGEQQTNDLAAGKGSGSIEYQCDTWCVLRTVPGDQNLVTLSIPKNRLGAKTAPDAPLEFQGHLKHVHLLALNEDAKQELHSRATAETLKRSQDRIMRAAQSEPGLSTRELRQAAKGSNADFARSLRGLVKDGKLTNRGTEKKASWWPANT